MLEDPRVTYLKGNHEDMMCDAILCHNRYGKEMYSHWTHIDQGGSVTMKNLLNLNLPDYKFTEIINKINQLPLLAEYENDKGIRFIMCHAGFTPGENFSKLTPAKQIEAYLWDRNHFVVPWSSDSEYQKTVIVHGHTPMLLMKQWYGFKVSGLSPFIYSNYHKINLDAATAHTGMAFLYNLDTLDYEIFLTKTI